MPLYFIIQSNRQMGPYERDELKKIPLQPDTLVWRYGFVGWRAAGTIEELARLLPPMPFDQFIFQEAEEPEEEPAEEVEESQAPYYYAYFVTPALLALGWLGASFTYSILGVFSFTLLAVGVWLSFQQFFVASDDKMTAKFIWGIMGAYVVYFLAYLHLTDLKWTQDAAETFWAIGSCRTLGNCSVEELSFTQRLTTNFQQIWPWLVAPFLAVVVAAFRLWKASSNYSPTLFWVGLTSIVCIPAWMYVHLTDRMLGTTSIDFFSAPVLLLPFILIVVFLYEMDTE